MYAIAIHGGAGVVKNRISDAKRANFEISLGRIVDAGYKILEAGGTSLDAVTVAVSMLEDDALFNAGRGAALTSDGTAELDAAIMDGATLAAGTVAAIKHVKNPVQLARKIMEASKHVMIVGEGAERFAQANGFAFIENEYFLTDERRDQLKQEQQGLRGGDLSAGTLGSVGTVGAVALDQAGNLAAATSTGGMTNKLPGRVGDSPIIGAGTYAKNGVCAVSATGHGEFFIRSVAAHHVASAVERQGISLRKAVGELIHDVMPKLGGLGGLIAISSTGEIVMDFNTEGMFRGANAANGPRIVAITS